MKQDSIKKKYRFGKAVAYLSFLIGIYGTYFAPDYLKFFPIILSVVGIIYYVLGEHSRIENGDELEKKIYLESLSLSFNTLIVAIWAIILIDINIYKLGSSTFTIIYLIGFLGIWPSCKFIVRKKYS
ncbi:MAG: hypothetical protein FD122_1536 [Stygiobacter sp.]|nr:MAG: hypothetical protein FD122_1536 [Stygiobacter sp.]KAF0214392.1 MAG: hypothetical protein FD178_2468 [Ignavibacteria bacterium]